MNPYVVAWCIIAALGVVLSVYLIIEAIVDLRALHLIGNGRRKRTWIRLISECIRLAIHSGFLAIGLPSLNAPVNPDAVGNVLVLIGGNVGLIVNSFLQVYLTRLEPSHGSIARAAADDLIHKAETAAAEIIEVAKQAAAELKRIEMTQTLDRGASAAEATAKAAEETAANTAEIAENTRPENGEK